MTTPRERLQAAIAPDLYERLELEHLLRYPSCWPADDALRGAAARLGLREPLAPAPGETLLVSLSSERDELWLLRPRSGGTLLVGDAAAAASLAWTVTASTLPALREPALLARPPLWSAERVASVGRGRSRHLDGRSYGLALMLASASLLVDEPLDPGVVACAAINPAGQLVSVEGLERKLRLLSTHALGASRVLVASGQEAEANAILSALGSAIRVRPCPNVGAALAEAFPDLLRLATSWRSDADRRRALDSLFRQTVLREIALLEYAALGRAAEQLAEDLAGDADAAWRAGVVAHIARRHGGGTAAIDWPAPERLGALPRRLRLELLAHVVQSHADAHTPEVGACVARAQALIPADRGECGREELILLGAVGRALAAMGRHRDAVKALEDAVRGWCDVLLEHEASYALSELLRLAGCLGDVDLLQRVEVELLPRFVLHARSSPDSRAFVALAAGRAAFELGRLKDAIQHLADAGAPWHAAPSHCNRSRLRWLARSRRAIGDSAVAERILLGLLSGCPYPTEATGSGTWLAGSRAAASLEAADDFALLALVDAELEAGDPVPPLLALERRAPESVCAILGDATRDRAAASKVASEWRY